MIRRPLFEQVTIVGLGLMGGSLGIAIRRHGLAKTVVGLSRSAATLHKAGAVGAIDIGTLDPRKALERADLVILAVPVDVIVPMAKRLSRFAPPGAVFSDVGSTKSAIVRALDRGLPKSMPFVGAHPIAGSEERGIAAASEAIFSDAAYCVVTPTAKTNRAALRAVTHLWKAIVPRVVAMKAQRHDQLLAGASHLPHALAFALAASFSRGALPAMPRSFLDMTRIAKSDPDLWRAIFLSNRAALKRVFRAFDRNYRGLTDAIESNRADTLCRILARAKARRHDLESR